jgi:hypothetical protein
MAAGVAFITAVGMAVVLGARTIASMQLAGSCGNDICREFPSPGGSQRLVMYQRDCGATTYWSVQAKILPEGAALPDESGMVLMRHGACLGRDAELPSVRVSWSGEDSLTLTFPGAATAETSMSGVRIVTKTGPPQ